MNLLRLPEVVEITRLSKGSIYRLLGTGDFPQPVRAGVRAVRWRADEIQKWIATRARASAKNFDLNAV